MRAVALTDHGNMFGAIQFYKACKDQGVQAILGCEVNVARRPSGAGRAGHADETIDHLVLLAANEAGYKNLVRIVSQGHVDPQSSLAPSVTLDIIEANKSGILGLTGCMGGVVAQRCSRTGEAAGVQTLERACGAFEPGASTSSCRTTGSSSRSALNGILAAAAADLGLPVVATNDAHFATREDGEGHLYSRASTTGRSAARPSAHHGASRCF